MSDVTQQPTADLAPMHERRPEWVEARILDVYPDSSEGIPEGYWNFGTESSANYDFPSDPDRYAFDILKEVEAIQDRALRVLDIGTGAGAFVVHCLNRGHEAIGLSAHDFRIDSSFAYTTAQLPPEAYVVGDANNLSRINALGGMFDLIVSRWTLTHVVDPLSVIEQAANKVRTGGILAVDEFFDFHGIYPPETNPNNVFKAVEQGGFVLQAARGGDSMGYVMISSRTDDTIPVRLPVDYRQESNVSGQESSIAAYADYVDEKNLQ